MGELAAGNNHEPSVPYEYYFDGTVRRRLHEFGAREFAFYDYAITRMGYGPGDIAIDVGAGMGEDGGRIAWGYRPRIVFLLDPAGIGSPDFDTRYYPLSVDLSGNKLSGVDLLHSADLDTTVQELDNPSSTILRSGRTYIQPVPGYAESIPLPSNSVTKLTMIHSIYEFNDVDAALKEAARVMTEDALGMIITNGRGDKRRFKELLKQTAVELNYQSGGNVLYTPPKTVSSKIDYTRGAQMISEYFNEVTLIQPYTDDMMITSERAPDYIYSFDTYKRRFTPPVINDGRWIRARQKVLIDIMDKEIAKRGAYKDSIDISAIYFRRPRK